MANLKFDINQLFKFNSKLKASISNDIFQKALQEALLELGLILLSKTVNRTPVDTGELKRSWKLSKVIKEGNLFKITLYNPKEYAQYVEFGHRTRNSQSWVPGRFMATISLKEVEKLIPQYINSYMSKAFNNI